jgi:hypothetical protein
MDRSAEFRQSAVAYARNAGFDQAKLAKVSSWTLLPPIKSRSEFRAAANSVVCMLFLMRNTPVVRLAASMRFYAGLVKGLESDLQCYKLLDTLSK